jgi:hypothetical protein
MMYHHVVGRLRNRHVTFLVIALAVLLSAASLGRFYSSSNRNHQAAEIASQVQLHLLPTTITSTTSTKNTIISKTSNATQIPTPTNTTSTPQVQLHLLPTTITRTTSTKNTMISKTSNATQIPTPTNTTNTPHAQLHLLPTTITRTTSTNNTIISKTNNATQIPTPANTTNTPHAQLHLLPTTITRTTSTNNTIISKTSNATQIPTPTNTTNTPHAQLHLLPAIITTNSTTNTSTMVTKTSNATQTPTLNTSPTTTTSTVTTRTGNATRIPTREPKFAYAFLLAGIPSPGDGATTGPAALRNEKSPETPQNAYRGLFYNILVSVKILRDAGSKAEFVVLVHLTSSSTSSKKSTELPDEDYQLFRALHIQIKYLPPTPSVVNEFSTLVIEKFRILELVQYDRVMFLDADVMPYCNLDYLMELTYGPHAMLQENVLISIGDTPASGTLFVLTPGPEDFARLLNVLAKWNWYWFSFKTTTGWGVAFTRIHDSWKALSGISGTKWDFVGAQSDQGLLLHWAKFVKQRVSIVIGDTIETWVDRTLVQTLSNNPLKSYSCLPRKDTLTIGNMWYPAGTLQQTTSPKGVAPYRDFAQWQFNPNKPWHYPKAPPAVDTVDQVRTARKFWFHVARQLDQELPTLRLNFTKNQKIKDPSELVLPEKYDAFDEANWNFVPKRRFKEITPVWSTKVQSLQQWALRTLVDTSQISFPWESPVWEEEPTYDTTSAKIRTLRTQCSCPETITVDPCSSSRTSPEDWLSHRTNYYLSKQRPLCPQAARHKVAIVVPFYQLNKEELEQSLCSVACQDYPPEKMSLLLFDDNSEDNTVLESVCGVNSVLKFEPLQDSDMDETSARKHTADSVKQHQGEPSQFLCVQSRRKVGPEASKYWALRLLESQMDANDIVILVKGGDRLSTLDALQTINKAYVDNGSWTTFGPIASNETSQYEVEWQPIPEGIRNGSLAFLPRQDQPTWRYGPPYTFKTHLLKHLSSKDFLVASSDRSWDRPTADHGFFNRLLEISGVRRVAFTPGPLYESTGTADYLLTAAQLVEIKALPPSEPLELPIHVVLVCWDRLILLKDQLVWLREQQLRRKIHLHLVNNNPAIQADIETIVADFRQTQPNMDVTVVHNKENWHAFSRFVYVRELRRREPLDDVAFVDDDQYWPPNFIASLLDLHQPKGIVTWYGKTFAERNTDTGLGDFWVSSLRWTDILKINETRTQTFTYAGPGGAVLDANLWLLDQQLFRLTSDLKAYFEFDDVWISYILDSLLGWEIRRMATPLPVDIANCNRTILQQALFPLLPPGQPEKLLELQRQIGHNLSSVATYSGTSRKVKTKMFEEMQMKFHWNVFRPESSPIRTSPNPYLELPSMPVATAPSEEKESDKRAFVCVTGQFDRFELQTKIARLFLPLQEAGYKTDAALVLSSGQTSFTNANKKKLDFQSFYANFSDAILDLEIHDIRVLSRNGTYPRLANPPMHSKYLSLLFKSQRETRTWKEQRKRASNHARIFDSYRRCLEYADEAAEAAGWGPRQAQEYYKVFVRIRDDAGLNRPLSSMENVMMDAIPPPPRSIVVTECRNWHGMNDRFAIVSPDVARLYFERPFAILSSHHNLEFVDPNVVTNPESFLLNTYTMAKVNVLGHANLKRVNRVVKLPNGNVIFYQDDKYNANCPAEDVYMKRNYDLYGWFL